MKTWEELSALANSHHPELFLDPETGQIIQIIEGQEVPQARIANRKLLADAPALENVEK